MPDNSTTNERTPTTPPSRRLVSFSDLLIAVLVCAATWGGYAYLSSSIFIPPAPVKRSEVAAPAVQVRVIIDRVRVHPVKANGKRWDVGIQGLPDLRVMVANDTRGGSRWTNTVNDTLKATFDVPTVTASPGDRLRVRVEDVDTVVNDLVGEHTFTLTNEMIVEEGVELSFGQVESLKLVFRIEG